MLSRVIFGSRISISGGVMIVLCAALIGITLGLWARYNEGVSGTLIMWVVEFFCHFLPPSSGYNGNGIQNVR